MMAAFLLLILIAALGSGAMVAIFAWMINRMKQIESGGGGDLARISEQLDSLRDQLASMEDGMGKLNERVDFTEKLLESPRTSEPGSPEDPEAP